MPAGKKRKPVLFTKTKKHGVAHKTALYELVRKCADEYSNIGVITVRNEKNEWLSEIRKRWPRCRLVLGKRRVMAKALGQDAASEYKDNLHKVSAKLRNKCGLLFTNDKDRKRIIKWLDKYDRMHYAKAGAVATETIILEQGPLLGFHHTFERELRHLGLNTTADKGVITLNEDFTVCAEGQQLTDNQAQLLILLKKKLIKFEMKVKCMWNENGEFVSFEEEEEGNDDDEENMEEETEKDEGEDGQLQE